MRLRCFAVLLTILIAPVDVFAGLLRPGQTVGLHSSDLDVPTGTLIAQQTQPLLIDYGVKSPTIGFDGWLRGSFHQAVYADATGRLTFLYDIDLGSPGIAGASEQSDLAVWSFKGVSTSVMGSLDYESIIDASRSGTGSRIRLKGNTPGLGGAPLLVVETDATDFDAEGTATYAAADEVPSLLGPSTLASGSVTLRGVYRPVAIESGNGGTVPPPPAAIPLPPAFYSGVGLMMGMLLLAITRRFWSVAVR
jgi:hypothetical protein